MSGDRDANFILNELRAQPMFENPALDREKLLELLDEKKRQYNFWRAR